MYKKKLIKITRGGGKSSIESDSDPDRKTPSKEL